MNEEYQPQLITIKTKTEGDVTFEAMVKVGTGLAYHRNYASKGKFYKTYNVTHIASGFCISTDEFDNPEAVRRFIELIVPLANWNQPKDAFMSGNQQAIRAALMDARDKALELNLSRRGAKELPL